MDQKLAGQLREWERKYNDPQYFREDPIAFPRKFADSGASLQDIEISAIFSAHFAWGRRSMIVRDCARLFDEMQWKPYEYVMGGRWRCDEGSAHRTVRWSEIAAICGRLKGFYTACDSLEKLSVQEIRTEIYGQKEDRHAACKKINMMRRWMVRRDGKVDLGLWTHTSPASLIMPLDVHVHTQALALGLTCRRQACMATAEEITDAFREIWPEDPVRGDFALFGYGVSNA
ncbi:MAG: TIGR02757 family protein [Bacteroidales bacterium]|nr:TIGR02757 family protein [Bacteroidales bacterium]